MSAEPRDFDEEVYDDEVEYEGEYEVDDDGIIEEVEIDGSEGDEEEIGAEGKHILSSMRMHDNIQTNFRIYLSCIHQKLFSISRS